MNNIIKSNKSGELRGLFKESLMNSRSATTVSGRISPIYRRDKKECRIYFYEWSDVSRNPIMFESVDSFETFLRNSGIYLKGYECEMCENIGAVYACCYYGSKQLCIRGSYKLLCNSMNENVTRQLISSVQGMSPKDVISLM